MNARPFFLSLLALAPLGTSLVAGNTAPGSLKAVIAGAALASAAPALPTAVLGNPLAMIPQRPVHRVLRPVLGRDFQFLMLDLNREIQQTMATMELANELAAATMDLGDVNALIAGIRGDQEAFLKALGDPGPAIEGGEEMAALRGQGASVVVIDGPKPPTFPDEDPRQPSWMAAD